MEVNVILATVFYNFSNVFFFSCGLCFVHLWSHVHVLQLCLATMERKRRRILSDVSNRYQRCHSDISIVAISQKRKALNCCKTKNGTNTELWLNLHCTYVEAY